MGTDYSNEDNRYLAKRVGKLSDAERHVNVIFDEIYVAKKAEYSGGKVVGLTEDGDVAGRVLCFMASSVHGKYCDIVGIYPVARLTADRLNAAFRQCLQRIRDVGLDPVCICADNLATNRRFYAEFLCKGPLTTKADVNGADLFLITDPTHCVKSIFNSWVNRKELHYPEIPTDGSTTASFGFAVAYLLFFMFPFCNCY